MNKLILIKHASPQVDPAVPTDQWHLSDRGRSSCELLAVAIAAHRPRVIVSSPETKALETAQAIAGKLEIDVETAEGLGEHDRSNVPHLRTAEFISMMELFFRRPGELVLGRETANAALERFKKAIERVIDNHAGEDIAIVSHGTVLALLLAEHSGKNPFQLWRELSLPSFAVLEIPNFKLCEVVPRIG